MIHRREFLTGGLSLAALAALPWPTFAGAPNEILFGSRYNAEKKKFFVGVFNPQTQKSFEIPVSFKGHGFAVHPSKPGRVILFGHIPSTTSCEIDVLEGKMIREFHSDSGRHFYGHGTFSPDGKHILATENDYNGAHGAIVVRDYETLKITGEFPSFGIDPHDMDYCDGGRTLLVANGGLKVRPDYHDSEMAEGPLVSSLAWIDASERKLLKKIELDNRSLSLRHLCRLPGDRYAVIIQDKGFGGAQGGLIVLLDSKRNFQLIAQEKKWREKMRHHTLSVAYLKNDLMAVTSPNGSCLTIWNAKTGAHVKTLDAPQVSGVVAINGGAQALLSLNSGETLQLETAKLSLKPVDFHFVSGFKWGAHLGSVSVS